MTPLSWLSLYGGMAALLFFGDTGLVVAVAFFAIAAMVQHTLGPAVLSRAAPSRQAFPLGVFLACGVVVLLRVAQMDLPQPVLESARLIGSLSVPLMLLSLGHALVTVNRTGLRRGCVVGVIRLLAGFAAGITVTNVLELAPPVASVISLQLMLPVAVVSYIYAQRYTEHGEVAAGAVFVSTVLFVVLSPVALWRLGVSI